MTALALAADLHNEYRKLHGVPPVELDFDLCEAADSYATSLAAGEKTNEPTTDIGRNIFQIQTSTSSTRNPVKVDTNEAVKEAITTWYGHMKDYNWESPLSSGQHARLFAQMVWKASKNIGVGVATKGVNIVVVILYTPLGNIVDGRICRENVLKPKAAKK